VILINRILTYEISLDTALFLFILFIVLFGFLMIISSIFSLQKDLKRKELQGEVQEEIPEQKPENKDVFESLEKDFDDKPSSGLRTLAAVLFCVSLLLFPLVLSGGSHHRPTLEMDPWMIFFMGVIFFATAIVFACLWRREYTFIENRNTQTSENFPSRFLRFFICHSRLSGLLSIIFIFSAYDLVVFNITHNGLIITALFIYAFIFFLLAIVKKKPSQA
jgi:hypothetical protein